MKPRPISIDDFLMVVLLLGHEFVRNVVYFNNSNSRNWNCVEIVVVVMMVIVTVILLILLVRIMMKTTFDQLH